MTETLKEVAERLTRQAVEYAHYEQIKESILAAMRAALAGPSEAMVDATNRLRIEQWDGNVSDIDGEDAKKVWKAMAAERLKEL